MRIYSLYAVLLFSLFAQSAYTQHYSEPDSSYLFSMRMSAASQEWDLWVNEVAAINNSTITTEFEEYEDWVEIFNYGDEPVDLHLAYVSDDPDDPTKHMLVEQEPGELIIQPGGFLVLWADGFPDLGARHLNFSLSGGGEFFGIYEPQELLLIDGIEFGQQISDVTYGRTLDGGAWNFFTTPTPGAPNDTEGLFAILPQPIFSFNQLFFESAVNVNITVADPEAEIRYTLDGTEPDEASSLYTSPVEVTHSVMLRAKAFRVEYLPSRTATNTYMEPDDFSLDVISIVTDSTNLWGPTGIYDNRYTGLEKPIHIEYFNPEGALQFEVDGGVKIHAPDNRPQQSLRLYMRSNYGDNHIDYQLFEEKNVQWFKRLILRQGANDGQQLARTHFRDCMAHQIFSEMDPDNIYSAYKPVNVYLNGEYWGIYNMRERQDQHFIESNYGFTDVDFLERTATTADTRDQRAGDWEDYDTMRDYLMQNDMADEDHYAVIEDWIDIRNYVDYMVTEIWTGNRDWLTNNVKFYRPRNMPETKWKWILWDTEYGMGCYPANDHGQSEFNALHMAMTWGGWPPHWGVETSTYMMNNLKDNPAFVDYFITRHADLLNSWLRPDRVQEQIDDFKALYQPDIPKQIARWGNSMTQWNGAIQTLENWNAPRASYCREHIINKFSHVENEHVITLNVTPEGAGYIKVNTIFTDDNPWSGFYFDGVPVNLTAIAHPGFVFEEWIEPETNNVELQVWLNGDTSLTALFAPSKFFPGQVVINEINYRSAPWLDTGDWVEFTNTGDAAVSLENWQFKDGNDMNSFTFEPGNTLGSEDFLVLCANPSLFALQYPDVDNVLGPFDFGFSSNGELLRLFDPTGDLIDFVEYGVSPPWPVSPNGLGPTLELMDPLFDNTMAQNWFARDESGGTPGAPNLFITGSVEDENVRVQVFPNPSQGQFMIQLPQETRTTFVAVYNAMGQLITQEQISTHLFALDLSDQDAGIYFARFFGENFSHTLSLVKQ